MQYLEAETTFHHDPGHGWLEIPIVWLAKLDLIEKISPYSYMHKDRVFLEEDCDYSAFVEAVILVNERPWKHSSVKEQYHEEWPGRWQYLGYDKDASRREKWIVSG